MDFIVNSYMVKEGYVALFISYHLCHWLNVH